MPTTYAHWRFGQDCIKTLPAGIQEIIENNIDIFNLGVHGPDIFFYDLKHNDVAEFGSSLHQVSGKDFFENCKEVYKNNSEKDMMLSYLLGFMSHYTLDSMCHGYIEHKKEVSGVSHNKIESEWDGHVIVLDNRKVNLVDRAESLRPNKKICKVMSYFFPYDEKIVYGTCKYQRLFISLLNYVSTFRRNFMEWLMLRLHKNDYVDLLIDPIEDLRCIDSNLRLDKLKEKAVKLYPKLANNYMDYLNNKTNILDDYFSKDFEKGKDYLSIPVLSYKEELNYKVK